MNEFWTVNIESFEPICYGKLVDQFGDSILMINCDMTSCEPHIFGVVAAAADLQRLRERATACGYRVVIEEKSVDGQVWNDQNWLIAF